MSIRYLPDSPPVFDTSKARARWAAAKADYLAGGGAPEVCERHGLSLRTFRWRASKEGWRRADQPAPFIAPEPEPAPPQQDEPLVIPEATEAPSAPPPLTTSQMVDTCWSHVQAAVAAGQLIQARGWLRLYKELKPFARFEEIAAREARMEQAAADLRAVEAAENAPADEESVALPLHSFSASESHEPHRADDDPIDDPAAAAEAATPISTSDLVRLAARLATVAEQVEQAAHDEAVRLPLHSFSRPESHDAPPDALDQAMRALQSEILSLKGAAPLSDALPGAP
ncbi:hypothetical protein IWC96_08440 [Brevundimonas sp. BAL450]|uniref:hypothetical protein n=2 Tax=Brevundimonas TaxID=41275 RepID=UPI0018CBED7E|nr:hypothetical protein [Brevundimonas sp. BAL450]MBG7615310.1 hypothetical protein [Brevundimonas sp. BAL450]